MSLKIKLYVAVALCAVSAFSYAGGFMSKHAQNQIECASCHTSGLKAPEAKACLTCHYQDMVAKETEKFNFTAKLFDPKTKKEVSHEAKVNPHDSYHFGKTQNCLDCHKEHKKSVNTCATCHDVKPWKMGEPR